MWNRSVAAAALIVIAGCTDRTLTPPDEMPQAVPAVGPSGRQTVELAKVVAKGLKNAAFRAYLKAQLDASPYREHKLQFEAFLAANSGRALRQIAGENDASGDMIARQAKEAIALEVYFPVAEHAAAWSGDENVLVATALTDDDPPVAFDSKGRQLMLDPKTPPATPVLALVPVETDFTVRPALGCVDFCGGGGVILPPPPPPPGLYMTRSHIGQDFEGWLKGSPEFEVHILGQRGQTDSLTDYQCAGEHAGGPYTYDQNDDDWSGRVLLFSKNQLDQYNTQHPGQNIRVFFVEDDDTACQIKTDPDRFQKLITYVDSLYSRLTSGNDSSNAFRKYFAYAQTGRNIWKALAAFFKSNDELVGTAVDDDIVDVFYPGYNWFVKGSNNVTNGWINLVMY